jgi:hypothetical protein
MCFKKIIEWFKQDAMGRPDYTKNTIVPIIVGNYPGTANDLAGPPYDQVDFQEKILSLWPHYIFRTFIDSEATAGAFLNELQTGVSLIEEGDLLLFINDNCFSESNTKCLNSPKILGSRFFNNPNLPLKTKIKSRALRQANNYLSMSACLDHETAADAEFEHPNGAYHYALIKTLEKGITYQQWHERAFLLLKQMGFQQSCTLEGPFDLRNRIVFEGNVICYETSSHGSYTYDKDGDELDGQDEGPYLYDRMVLDDEINSIISTNNFLV